MRHARWLPSGVIFASATAVLAAPPNAPPATSASPEARAVAFLSREVPRWSVDNKCYSCHNNGDAARALYAASALGHDVPRHALADTTAWLSRPNRWDENGRDPSYSDKRLTHIQFAAALSSAVQCGAVKDRRALEQAAEILVRDQQPDGSWPVDAAGTVGSPATYGAVLATHQAVSVLRGADKRKYQDAIARSDAWLTKVDPRSVLDAAAILLARPADHGKEPAERVSRALDIVRRGQSRDGGWGPYASAPPEPFDTAVVLLALSHRAPMPIDAKEMVQQGRAFLVRSQREAGDWPETTRPAGGESYAQRISTTAWATLALLETGKTAVKD